MSGLLPAGWHHHLQIEHELTGRGGQMDRDAAWKTLLHTTEELSYEGSKRDLVAEDAEPHFLLGQIGTRFHVCQFIPLHESSRSLEHPSPAVTPPTNGARCVQIEIAAMAITHTKARPDFSPELYDALARLCLMIESRVPVARERPRAFGTTPHRFGAEQFIRVGGIVGHEHAPNQTQEHWDPGALDAGRLLRRMDHFGQWIHS